MYLLTAPTAEPVTVSQAKAALRIDDLIRPERRSRCTRDARILLKA